VQFAHDVFVESDLSPVQVEVNQCRRTPKATLVVLPPSAGLPARPSATSALEPSRYHH
jgi:hypothetical protein